jgi:hypothetical protein
MNQKQRAKWEQTRAKGMWRFVLLYGVLIWGGSMSIATSLIALILNGRDNLMIRVPIFLISGFFFGLGCWFYAEFMYRKDPDNASSNAPSN